MIKQGLRCRKCDVKVGLFLPNRDPLESLSHFTVPHTRKLIRSRIFIEKKICGLSHIVLLITIDDRETRTEGRVPRRVGRALLRPERVY